MSEMTLTWTTDTVEYRTVPYSFLTDSNPKVPESHLLAVESLRSTAADPNLGNGIDRDNYRRQGKFHHYFLIYNNVFEFWAGLNNILLFSGYVLTAFQLLPISGNALSVNRRGTIKLAVKFRTPLPEPVNVILYCQYQSLIELGKNGQCTLDR